MWSLVLCGVLLTLLANAASLAASLSAAQCKTQTKPLRGFDTGTISCWWDAVLPSAALDYSTGKLQSRTVAAANWARLQELVLTAEKELQIKLEGVYEIDHALKITRRASLSISGPATVSCRGNVTHPAIIINRSSNIVLQDITFTGCSQSAVVISGTAGSKQPLPITQSGSKPLPPDVVLQGVTVQNCSSDRAGGGVAVIASRVVLQDCSLHDNVAAACGGGIYAENSSLLVMNSEFTNNLGNNTAGDDQCRGGALHAQQSWLAVTRSTFIGNQGVNGSAVLVLLPVGVAQLHDSKFINNQPRPGVSQEFFASSGAVTVVGKGWYYVEFKRGGSVDSCSPITQGLAVVRCHFQNNTAASTGGEGGAVSSFDTFLAIINSTVIGTPSVRPGFHPAGRLRKLPPVGTGTTDEPGTTQLQGVAYNAYLGGCFSVESSSFLLVGSDIKHCNARFVGGGVSMLAVSAVMKDALFLNNAADMGGGVRVTNGYLLMSSVSVLHNQALSAGGGIYLESNNGLDVHMEHLTVSHNTLSARGGGMLAEMVEDRATFVLSIHNSTYTHNLARYGGAMALYSVSKVDLSNNHVAHNTAVKFGGGLHCARYYGSNHSFQSNHNVWRNNTALERGGGVITHPCNMTSDGDMFVANQASEGGGFMAYGGEQINIVRANIACNSAAHGAGVMVRVSDSGDSSHVNMTCSRVTANGGAADAAMQAACVLATSNKHGSMIRQFAEAATAAASERSASGAVPTLRLGADKGGGVYVADYQSAVIVNSSVDSNVATNQGGGVYLGKVARLQVLGVAGSVSNCTAGYGAALYLDDGAVLSATSVTWINNQGLFAGGGIFAYGNNSRINLQGVTFSNNTAGAGAGIATWQGSSVSCNTGCRFLYNTAQAGGALMLRMSSGKINRSIFLGNVATADSSSDSGAAPGPATTTDTIRYLVKEVHAAAGGAVHIMKSRLQLTKCQLISNVVLGSAARGGGVFVDDGQLQMTDTLFRWNWASAAGGAVLLGPVGRQQLQVQGGSFVGNAAGLYGGAVAGGLLLPGDAAAALSLARIGVDGSAQWTMLLRAASFSNNAAGRQGGAIACNVCDRVLLQDVQLQGNAATETGGGISCVRCNQSTLDNTTCTSNTAASGGGACILAAGPGSFTKDSKFEGNTAGAGAAAAVEAASRTAATAAAALLGHSRTRSTPSISAAAYTLPTLLQAMSACGVVGAGGGLCLGLFDAEYQLLGPNTFLNNSGSVGSGLFVESCSGGPQVCPLKVDLRSVDFTLDRNGANTTDRAAKLGRVEAESCRGLRSSMYVTNATVLLAHYELPIQQALQNHDRIESSKKRLPATVQAALAGTKQQLSNRSTNPTPAEMAATGRHLHGQMVKQSPIINLSASDVHHSHLTDISNTSAGGLAALAIVQQLAAATSCADDSPYSRFAPVNQLTTRPARLGAVMLAAQSAGQWAASGPSHDDQAARHVTVSIDYTGRLPGLSLPVLDQLGGLVVGDEAEQLSVQATALFDNCTACRLAGVSKVVPTDGVAEFSNLQIVAPPGSNQTVTFKLVSALDGVELAGSGGQSIQVSLPSCYWGQATTAVGCTNCTSPLFSFRRDTGRCSKCPRHVSVCTSTTLLPASGYWHSGPLNTRMHRCPRRSACVRDADVMLALQCLQQQRLLLSTMEATPSDAEGVMVGSNSSGSRLSAWDRLRQQCTPVLQNWADQAAADMSSSNTLWQLSRAADSEVAANTPTSQLNSSTALDDAYRALLCAEGYTGRLCTQCVFPGSAADGVYGRFYTVCGKCPSWAASVVAYALSRMFDICVVGLLVVTMLMDMEKRKAAVSLARQAALHIVAVAQKAAAALVTTPASAATATLIAAAPSTAPAPASQPTGDGQQDSALQPTTDVMQHSCHMEQHRQTPAQQQLHSGSVQIIPSTQPDTTQTQKAAGNQQCQPATPCNLFASEITATGSADPEVQREFQQQFASGCSTPSDQGGTGDGRQAAAPEGASNKPGSTPSVVGCTAALATPLVAAVSTRQRQRRHLQQGPLFAREVTPTPGCSAMTIWPAQLTTENLLEVFKDFLQLLSILQAVSVNWQSAAVMAMFNISITPLSTRAWISLDCILPRTQYMAEGQPFYRIAAAVLEPLLYALLILLVWLLYGVHLRLRTKQPSWRVVLVRRLKAPVISSLLVLLSLFYPSLAFTVLGVFSCRYLDPPDSSIIPGEVLTAQGWYWTADLNRQCFADPGHRAIALGLGLPGTILLLVYPLLQAAVLARRASAGDLTDTSQFFADYGHLVEDFRPRLFYWGSIVELRNLVLVALVLGLASIGVVSQLLGCILILLGYCTATLGLLPYPYRLLNCLHLGSTGVLLFVVWLNLVVAVGEEGGYMSPEQTLALQMLSVACVLVMFCVLLWMLIARLYRKVKEVLDVDGDEKVSWADIQALLARLQAGSKMKGLLRLLTCFRPLRQNRTAT